MFVRFFTPKCPFRLQPRQNVKLKQRLLSNGSNGEDLTWEGRRLAQLRESARSYYETVNQTHIAMRWNLLKDDLIQQSEPSDLYEAPSADATGLNPC